MNSLVTLLAEMGGRGRGCRERDVSPLLGSCVSVTLFQSLVMNHFRTNEVIGVTDNYTNFLFSLKTLKFLSTKSHF